MVSGIGQVEQGHGAAAWRVEAPDAGQPVAVPTETVYGLAADARNAEAVARIYAAKGRPDFNPLIVHVPDLAAAERLGVFGEVERALAARFWPGSSKNLFLSSRWFS